MVSDGALAKASAQGKTPILPKVRPGRGDTQRDHKEVGTMTSENLIWERIPADFDVLRIGSYENVALFGAERKDLFHFVLCDTGSGLQQFHIPQYRIANAISLAAGNPEESLYPLSDGISLVNQRNGPLGVLTGGVCFLLNGSNGEPLGARMLRTGGILDRARKRVVSKSGVYTLDGANTHGGNPVSSKSRGLIEGIAFERALLRRLSATSTFGVYSAFCTHRDFPCPLERKSCLKEMVVSHFGFYDAHAPSEDFLQMALTVQDSLFPYRIWDADSKVPVDRAIEALAVVVSKLDPVQRTQWVLLNGMHAGSLFLQLATLTGVITHEDYRRFQTQYYQPDSQEEQWLRSTSSYIELFGDLGRAR
jgi:hypothetical protein